MVVVIHVVHLVQGAVMVVLPGPLLPYPLSSFPSLSTNSLSFSSMYLSSLLLSNSIVPSINCSISFCNTVNTTASSFSVSVPY